MTERVIRRLPPPPPRCPSSYLLPGEIPISCKLPVGHEGLHRDEAHRWIVEKAPSGSALELKEEAVSTETEQCGATTVFWPDQEAIDARCVLPRGHDPADRHRDENLGEWSERELLTMPGPKEEEQ